MLRLGAGATRGERFAQPGSLPVGAGESVVDADPLGCHAEPGLPSR